MAKAKGIKTFSVAAQVTVWCEVKVRAGSFAEALEQANQLRVEDFVAPTGEHIDSILNLVSVTDDVALTI